VSFLFAVKPAMTETTALGAAMAAGHCIGVWSLKSEDLASITTDTYVPSVSTAGTYTYLLYTYLLIHLPIYLLTIYLLTDTPTHIPTY